MDRFERQSVIRGWRQERFSEAAVGVVGRGWLGCFAVLGLASLGVGSVAWVGSPDGTTEGVANWLLADPCPIHGCCIVDYPFTPEYRAELEWALEERSLKVLLDCSHDPTVRALCRHFSTSLKIPLLGGVARAGGWFGADQDLPESGTDQAPVLAMLLAAILIDAVRETLCPLFQGQIPPSGLLGFPMPKITRSGKIALIGVGGIGVYSAFLAALLGYRLTLVDLDRVEESNLNRQGLFTQEHALRRTPKAIAASQTLVRLIPHAQIDGIFGRVDESFALHLSGIQPDLILSAVDNAKSRLLLQRFGRELGVPVVQGGTDVFAADCFTQDRGGPLLDEQMHGALSAALNREGNLERRHGTCAVTPSYVVPGMLCGALVVHRMVQSLESHFDRTPIRWRAGSLPHVERTHSGYEITLA